MAKQHAAHLTWPKIDADLRQSIINVWHGLSWTGNIEAANALVGHLLTDAPYYDHEAEPTVDLSEFEVAQLAKLLFDEALHRVNETLGRDDIEREFDARRLQTWIEMQPETSLYHPPKPVSHLVRLLHAVDARNTLRNLLEAGRQVDDSVIDIKNPFRLTVAGIAALAHMDERSVRNDVGPSEKHALVSLPRLRDGVKRRSKRDYSVEVDAYQALEWLAGRLYYKPLQVDPVVFSAVLREGDAQQVGRTIGLIVWSNIGTTKVAAKQLRWTEQEFDGWIRHGPTTAAHKRAQLSNLLKLDPAILAVAPARRS